MICAPIYLSTHIYIYKYIQTYIYIYTHTLSCADGTWRIGPRFDVWHRLYTDESDSNPRKRLNPNKEILRSDCSKTFAICRVFFFFVSYFPLFGEWTLDESQIFPLKSRFEQKIPDLFRKASWNPASVETVHWTRADINPGSLKWVKIRK